MLTQQRKKHILSILRRDGRVVARSVAVDLDISEDTIRRDLRDLARDGLLQRVHGGALPASPAVQNLEKRQAVSTAEKTAIGRAAAAMIRSGQVAFIDGGTTAVQLARQIDPGLRATLVTHSPLVAAELADHAAEVILIGGRLFRHSMVATGTLAMEAIARIRADLFFLGVTGIHPETGLTTGDAEEAAIKRALIAAAAETVVLASPEKLGAASPFLIAPVTAIATILTTSDVAPEELRVYERLGATVARAPA
ncbi:HTH-type transcriptional repressor GlcR [Alphaproteobacteria bacterium SO-S41]|nr:HTH-type transcriptional repressor GlcR [Alphaproteobacteria bacterium SO-S41]